MAGKAVRVTVERSGSCRDTIERLDERHGRTHGAGERGDTRSKRYPMSESIKLRIGPNESSQPDVLATASLTFSSTTPALGRSRH